MDPEASEVALQQNTTGLKLAILGRSAVGRSHRAQLETVNCRTARRVPARVDKDQPVLL